MANLILTELRSTFSDQFIFNGNQIKNISKEKKTEDLPYSSSKIMEFCIFANFLQVTTNFSIIYFAIFNWKFSHRTSQFVQPVGPEIFTGWMKLMINRQLGLDQASS